MEHREQRNSAIETLLYLATNPPSLCHLARRVVRQQLWLHTGGTSIIGAVFQLQCPPLLKQYLLLSDIRSCDIDHLPPHHFRFNCAKHVTYNKLGLGIDAATQTLVDNKRVYKLYICDDNSAVASEATKAREGRELK